jgi:hypothetical protein
VLEADAVSIPKAKTKSKPNSRPLPPIDRDYFGEVFRGLIVPMGGHNAEAARAALARFKLEPQVLGSLTEVAAERLWWLTFSMYDEGPQGTRLRRIVRGFDATNCPVLSAAAVAPCQDAWGYDEAELCRLALVFACSPRHVIGSA